MWLSLLGFCVGVPELLTFPKASHLSHPDNRYFVISRIDHDQLEDYARRKDWSLAEAKQWLDTLL